VPHANAIETREAVPVKGFQRPLSHTDLGVSSLYRQGIDITETPSTTTEQTTMMPANAHSAFPRAIGRTHVALAGLR
jgi:hypothetical protein